MFEYLGYIIPDFCVFVDSREKIKTYGIWA